MKDFQVRFIDANRPDNWVRREELTPGVDRTCYMCELNVPITRTPGLDTLYEHLRTANKGSVTLQGTEWEGTAWETTQNYTTITKDKNV